MPKWRHNDGRSPGTLAQLHSLLEMIERKTGDLSDFEPSFSTVDEILVTTTQVGESRLEFTKPNYAALVRDWVYDATQERRKMRKRLNEPTFGATEGARRG